MRQGSHVVVAESVRTGAAMRGMGEELPEAVGAYRVLALLGEGPEHRTYIGVDGRTGEHVAIRQLRPVLAASAKVRRAFVGGGVWQRRMAHGRILPVRAIYGRAEVCAIVTPFVAGASLAGEVARGVAVAEGRVLRIMLQVAEALDAAHADFGVAHGRVHAGNILVDGLDRAYVSDFGGPPAEVQGDVAAWGALGCLLMTGRRGDGLEVATLPEGWRVVLHAAMRGDGLGYGSMGEAAGDLRRMAFGLGPAGSAGKGACVAMKRRERFWWWWWTAGRLLWRRWGGS